MELDFSQASSKLYGREEQTKLLSDAFKHLSNSNNPCQEQDGPRCRSVLVKGRSGVGKSSLVMQTLREAISNDKEDGGAIFVSGKYDQNGSQQPYSALVEAFAELSNMIEAMNRTELNHQIQTVLGDDAPHFLTVIPPMEKIISGTPATSNSFRIRRESDDFSCASSSSNVSVSSRRSIKPGWAFERLKINVCSILEIISTHTKVVLFLDDLQWAEIAVLDIFQSLQDGLKNARVLLVGAYRHDEFEEDDPIEVRLEHLQKHRNATSIEVGNLDVETLNSFISSIIHRDSEETQSLAEVVFRKTDGNIFYVLQFLHSLQKKNRLYYSFQLLKWDWNTAAILSESRLSGNVVDLVASKIQILPNDVQARLHVAACLGNQFDATIVDEIIKLWNLSPTLEVSWRNLEDHFHTTATAARLSDQEHCPWEVAVEARFIDPIQSSGKNVHHHRYSFAHDRIQQAAASMMLEGRERRLLFLRIGRFLLRLYEQPEKSQEWMLLVAVNQLNRGIDLIDTVDERHRLALLNLQAAERVAAKSAFFPAAELIRVGIELLGDNRWLEQYEKTLYMAIKSVEYEYCCGRFERCKTRVAEVLIHAKSLEDKIDVYHTLIESLGAQKQQEEALEVGCKLLGELGFKFPKKVGVHHLLGEYMQVKRLLRNLTDDELSRLPDATDAQAASALKVSAGLLTFAWFADRMDVFALLIIRMVRISLKKGATKYTAIAFSFFGVVFSKFFQLKDARRMGKLGMRVLSRFGENDADVSTRVIFGTNVFLEHLNNPFHNILDPLLKCHETGLKTGDLVYGMLSSSAYCICYFLCGLPLVALDEDAENFVSEMTKYSQLTAIAPCLLHRQAALNLMGRSPDPLRLQGTAIRNIDALLAQGTEVENSRTNQVYTTLMMQMSYYMGDYTLGAEMARQNSKQADNDFPFFISTSYPFWRGLIFFALAQGGQQRYIHDARKQTRTLSKYVKQGGMINCHHMLLLLEAEDDATTFLKLSSGSKFGRTFRQNDAKNKKQEKKSKNIRMKYQDAIDASSRSGFPQASALANERAGLFCHRCSIRSTSWWASQYLKKALDLYAEWGAQVKVEQLEREYSKLIQKEGQERGAYLRSRSQYVKGRTRFDPNHADIHRSDDCFHLSDDLSEDLATTVPAAEL